MEPQRGREIFTAATRDALSSSDMELVRLQLEVDNDVLPTPEALRAIGHIAFELDQRLKEQTAEV